MRKKCSTITIQIGKKYWDKSENLHFIFFTANLVKDEGEFSGKIVIKSKNSQFKVQIPYRAFLVRGQLVVNNTATQFHLKTKTSAGIQRNLTVRL